MIDMDGNELVFRFPDVNELAELRVHFRSPDPQKEIIPLVRGPAERGFVLVGEGPAVLHLRPEARNQESSIRYPFAVLLTVGGLNALTGEPSNSLNRSPQNYFASPPQGGIDGYFVHGKVHPFRVTDKGAQDRARLEMKVFPMKAEMWAHLMQRRRLSGWGHPVITGLTLAHGGERQCEPVYEDMCCIGDWDQSHGETATVWMRR